MISNLLMFSPTSLTFMMMMMMMMMPPFCPDTGNLIHENPTFKYARLPYGISFFQIPTGRPSNGLLMIDYFTKYLKMPFLDPYLKKDGNFSHGVNFAVAGAAALNTSILAMKDIVTSNVTNSSLLVQLDWFKSHLNSICSTASECKEKLGKSLIMMGEIGGNDYNSVLFGKTSMLKAYDLVPEVVQVIKYVIKEVIKLGAIRIVVPGNFPVGCMAINLALYKTNDSRMYDELQCLKHLNQFAEFQNNKLQQAIRELQKDHPHVTIVYADYFSAFKEIIKHATSLGFDKDATMKVCCGVGENEYNFDMNRQCGSDGVVACEHPNQRIFWDGIHLTQHAYRIMANWLIKYNFDPIFSMT
ncbi:acetylajmalan esterase isoform X2 [Spinacia oleracea]|uniref:Acetylajmalan esterase isoform X2 n=1 Tax=Spinacia oleracea TaxID=3562 RepID=A0A9R0JBX3_SPIOL|nr:acetylajmalan esterase-like isoform X2 [Spinacia oleracea]